jgi:IPT/TIG domain
MGGFQSWEPNDAALNDSGSLEFAAGKTTVDGPPGLFILDTHHGDVLGNIVLQNQINVWAKTIAVDSTSQHVFMADSQGLTVLTLEAAPLAIGWISPAVASTSGSAVVTMRGSGFQTGTTVTIGGKSATAVYVDANTMQVTTPANAAGAAHVTVQNPDGETYSVDDALVYQ